MILDDIKRSRPNLAENTYRTYLYNLKGICKYMGHNPDNLDSIKFLQNYDKTIKCIEKNTESLSSIKSKLTAIIVALKSQKDVDKELVEKYSRYMENVIEKYDKFIEKNEKSIKQQKNWLDYRDLIGVCNKLMIEYEKLRKKAKQTELYDNEFKLLQGYIMLRLQLQYPIRNDMANMSVKNSKEYDDIEEKEKMKNNYLVIEKNNHMVLHINNYKTSKTLGPKQYKIPKNINKLLLQWLKINKTGFLFVKPNKRDTPINETDVSRLFIQLFKKYYPDKSISTSMIRHILITHDRQNDLTIQQQKLKNEKIENKYLHSSNMNSEYRKK